MSIFFLVADVILLALLWPLLPYLAVGVAWLLGALLVCAALFVVIRAAIRSA